MWNLAPYIRNILLYESSFRSVLAKNKPYSRKNLVSENHIRGRQCTYNLSNYMCQLVLLCLWSATWRWHLLSDVMRLPFLPLETRYASSIRSPNYDCTSSFRRLIQCYPIMLPRGESYKVTHVIV